YRCGQVRQCLWVVGPFACGVVDVWDILSTSRKESMSMTRSRPGQIRTARAARGTGSTTTPFRRQTVVTMTLEALRERILRGDYPEGAPLRQDAIAAEFGVSRIPVREALRQLEAEGLVTINPHQGATVSSLSIEEVRELFELRALIESDLLRRAIPHLTPEDIERAEEILVKYEEAFRQGDVSAWGELNWEFNRKSTRLNSSHVKISYAVF